MRTIAILPVKSFGSAKQRLSSALDPEVRGSLAQAMLGDVLDALSRVEEIDELVVVSADPAARELGIRVVHDSQEESQSAAAALALELASAENFDRALLVPGDTPLLDPAEVDALLERSERDGAAVTIVPDRHGSGTNALVLCPPDAIEPGFGPGSRARHADRARDLTCRIDAVPSLALDLDTPEDLEVLDHALGAHAALAPRTREALAQASRVGA